VGRKFRVTNISGGRGSPRTPIPIGTSSSLPPGRPGGRKRDLRKPGRHQLVIDESILRNFVMFFRRGQMSVEACDGQPLPEWLTTDRNVPAVTEAVPEPQKLEEEVAVETPPGDPVLDKSAREIVDWVEHEAPTLETLRSLLATEQAGKNRKSVIKILEGRIEELSK
jgi:hypothetical protein